MEITQLLISWLNYYSIVWYNMRQLLSMNSPESQLFNDIL